MKISNAKLMIHMGVAVSGASPDEVENTPDEVLDEIGNALETALEAVKVNLAERYPHLTISLTED